MESGERGSRCYVSQDCYLYDKLGSRSIVQGQLRHYMISLGAVGVHAGIGGGLAFPSHCVLAHPLWRSQ